MLSLLFSAEGEALFADGWRAPRERLVSLADGIAVLAYAETRLGEVEDLCRRRAAEAQAQGYADGLSRGLEAAKSEADATLRSVLRELAAFQREHRRAVGRLAIDVVRRLLGELGEERVLELFVLRRLEDLCDEQPLTLRVPDGAADRVSVALAAAGVSLRISEDPSLPPDACVFGLGAGSAHSGVEAHLSRFEASVASLCAEVD